MARNYPSRLPFEYEYDRRPSFIRRFRRSVRHFYRDQKTSMIMIMLASVLSVGILHGGRLYMELLGEGFNTAYDNELRSKGITPTRDARERKEIDEKMKSYKDYRERQAAKEEGQ